MSTDQEREAAHEESLRNHVFSGSETTRLGAALQEAGQDYPSEEALRYFPVTFHQELFG